jgi:hypothetical protein
MARAGGGGGGGGTGGGLHCSVSWAEKYASVRETFSNLVLSSRHSNRESFCQTHVLESAFPLPDILRKFNGNLTGYSVGTGDSSSANAFLNQAVPGAKAEYDIWGNCRKGERGTWSVPQIPHRDLQRDFTLSAAMILRVLFPVCPQPKL